MRRCGVDVNCSKCGRLLPKGAPNFYYNPRDRSAGKQCLNCQMPVWYNTETGKIEKAEEFKDFSVTTKAKFNGTCFVCGKPTIEGVSDITLCNDGKHWKHVFCTESDDEEFVTSNNAVPTDAAGELVKSVSDSKAVPTNLEKQLVEGLKEIKSTAIELSPYAAAVWKEIEPLVVKTSDGSTDTAKVEESFNQIRDLLKLCADTQDKLNVRIAARPVQELVVQRIDLTTISIDSPHPVLVDLIDEISLQHHVYLYGPAGSGKSTGGEQAAKALGIDFYSVSLNRQSTPTLLTGFIDAQGKYAETDFFKAFTRGGLYLIDEMDNASGNLLTTLNTALANGYMSFPCGQMPMNANFYCVGTGNTIGLGADRQYNERQQLDAATIDRFSFLPWGYDEHSELAWALAINDACKPWVDAVQKIRRNAEANNIRCAVTPRASIKGAKKLLQRPNMAFADMAAMYIFKGRDIDTVKKLSQGAL